MMFLTHVILMCYLAFVSAVAENENCDELGILIYEDLGCTPQYYNNTGCPKKYSCKGLEPSLTSCYFRNKAYADREEVDDILSSPTCDLSCSCSTDDGFSCASLDCPEEEDPSLVKPSCYNNYTLDECCAVGQICPPFNNITKCVVEGNTYKEGEYFYPNNTCLQCVCQKGFEGKLEEPFCRRQLCGHQLRRHAPSIASSCAAFYSKESQNGVLCCPHEWICPDGSEIVQGDAKSVEVCKFGDRLLKVGQFFARHNVTDHWRNIFRKVKCECVIPPLVRCIDV